MSQTDKKDQEAQKKASPADDKNDKPASAKEKASDAQDKPAPAKEPDQGPGEAGEAAGEQPEGPPAPEWEKDLEVYPLREAAEDPKWAVRTVWIWVGFGLISLAFILVLLVLGAIYD